MNTEVIVGFDPGLTIGTCIFKPGEKAMKLSKCCHLHNLDELTNFYKEVATSYENVSVVAESFARGNSVVKEQIDTLRLCGAIEALEKICDFKHSEQYPAERTGYVPIAKCMIKELSFGTLKENHHAIDAVAHVLCYMDKEGMDWQKQFWMRKAFQ